MKRPSNSDHDPHERLEQYIDRVLREQPSRRAPQTLQARVLAEIEQRKALAWWRRGFAHWPVAARLAFLAVSAVFVTISLQVATWIGAPLHETADKLPLPADITWIQTLLVASGSIIRSVPSLWVHAGLAIFALMYVALFGIGVSAYRTVRMVHSR